MCLIWKNDDEAFSVFGELYYADCQLQKRFAKIEFAWKDCCGYLSLIEEWVPITRHLQPYSSGEFSTTQFQKCNCSPAMY